MLSKSYKYTHNQWSEEFDPSLDSDNTMVLVFFDHRLEIKNQLKIIKKKFPQSKILGASTSGEIQNAEVLDDSIVCFVVKFDHTLLKLTSAPVNIGNSYEAGKKLAENLLAPDLKHIFLLSEGLNVDASSLITGLDETLKKHHIYCPVTGGLAGDSIHYKKTFIIHDDHVTNDHAVALGIYGEKVKIFSGIGTGWAPFGPMREVTKADRNTIYEIDRVPALQLYKLYLKEDAKNLPVSGLFFPLGINNEGIVRSVMRIDEEKNALIVAGSIRENTQVQLMHSNVMKLIEAAKKALDECHLDLSDDTTPTAALIVSCVGRRLIMGQKTEDEIDIIKESLPRGTEICGFYSYGEFSQTKCKQNELHNQTMTLIVFQEGS